MGGEVLAELLVWDVGGAGFDDLCHLFDGVDGEGGLELVAGVEEDVVACWAGEVLDEEGKAGVEVVGVVGGVEEEAELGLLGGADDVALSGLLVLLLFDGGNDFFKVEDGEVDGLFECLKIRAQAEEESEVVVTVFAEGAEPDEEVFVGEAAVAEG